MNLLDGFETYRADLPPLRELGLRPFSGKTWQEVFVGTVALDGAFSARRIETEVLG